MPYPLRTALVAKVLLASLCLGASVALAQMPATTKPVLRVGDEAPVLRTGEWVQGEKVSRFEPGTVYVIDCWATWSRPCKDAIPGLNALQKKYAGKVVVIGQNMWEENPASVAEFVARMGDQMTYRVALDDKSTDSRGAMARTWMDASAQNGIPCTFVVDQKGRLAWIGRPADLPKVLPQIVEGKYEPSAVVAHDDAVRAAEKKLTVAMREGNTDAAVKVIDELISLEPGSAGMLTMMKFQFLLDAEKYPEAYALGDALYEYIKDDGEQLNEIAWNIATEEAVKVRDLKLARKLAERGVQVSERKNSAVLDTLARILFDQGEIENAIKLQTEAVNQADLLEARELRGTLNRYKAALEKKSQKDPSTQKTP